MNKKLFLVPSVMIFILVVWIVVFYMPFHREMGVLEDRMVSFEEMEKQRISENQVRYLRSVLDSLYLWVDESMGRIYPEEQLLDLGRVVENIGKEYGLALISIVPDYESLSLFIEKSGEIAELPLMIQFRGRFQQFTQFMDDLTMLPYVLRVNEATIEKAGDDPESLELNMMLRGVIVLKKERTDAGENEIEQVIKPGLI